MGKRFQWICRNDFNRNFRTNSQRNFRRTFQKICWRSFGKRSQKNCTRNLRTIFQRKIREVPKIIAESRLKVITEGIFEGFCTGIGERISIPIAIRIVKGILKEFLKIFSKKFTKKSPKQLIQRLRLCIFWIVCFHICVSHLTKDTNSVNLFHYLYFNELHFLYALQRKMLAFFHALLTTLHRSLHLYIFIKYVLFFFQVH